MSMEMSEEEFRQKTLAVQASLDEQDEITIHAAVGKRGPYATQAGAGPHWTPHLNLIAWRVAEGPVQREDLYLDQQMSAAAISGLQEVIVPGSIIAFRAKLCECSHFGDTRARFISMLPAPRDEKLEAILHDFVNPVLMTDPVLGTLTLNKSERGFEGSIDWLGRAIRIHVALDDKGDVANALATAKVLVAGMAIWTPKVNDFAVTSLLDLKNDTWLDEDEAPLTREQFIARMQFDSLNVYAEGYFSFWHLDGDLFFGHYIQVCGSLHEGLTDADIPG